MDAKELVERCRRGEGQAMGLLYSAYVHKMERVCRRYVKQEADVQDVVHDSFVIIFTSLDRLKDVQKLESWMCTIVRNLALKHLQRPIMTSVESLEMEDGEADSALDYSHLMTVVEGLPTGYQNVLRLSVLEGLSHKEIGEMLGIGAHSSSSQLARAKVLLRRSIKRYAVLLLTLLAVVLPFFGPENEEEEKKAVAEAEEPLKEMEKGDTTVTVPSIPSKSSTFSKISKTFENIENVENIESAEETEGDERTDSLTTSPADTLRHARVVPDIRGERRVAEERTNIKRRSGETWTLGVSIAGGNGRNLLAQTTTPGASSGTLNPTGPSIDDPTFAPDTCTSTRTRHHMPLTFGLSLSRPLAERWRIEAGLRYTLRHADATTITYVSDGSMEPTQETTTLKTHYIGIPVKVSYNLWSSRRLSVYGSGGAALDIPVGTSAPVLWSLNFGAGIQYRLAPGVSLYAEPSLSRYLNAGHAAPTFRADRPMEFTLPVGLRISW